MLQHLHAFTACCLQCPMCVLTQLFSMRIHDIFNLDRSCLAHILYSTFVFVAHCSVISRFNVSVLIRSFIIFNICYCSCNEAVYFNIFSLFSVSLFASRCVLPGKSPLSGRKFFSTYRKNIRILRKSNFGLTVCYLNYLKLFIVAVFCQMLHDFMSQQLTVTYR